MQKSKIEWCTHTWNPVTGCKNNCPYCYARKIANRFMGHFEPMLHETRLNEPKQLKKPANIFVCSMADLFGDWVSDKWIEEVFRVCESTPQHRYLFLTKNPERYVELLEKGILKHNKNVWLGSTMPTPNYRYFSHRQYNTFISIEPILEAFDSFKEECIVNQVDWVIIGAETGNQKNKVIPRREWIESIVKKYRDVNVPVFMKNSLADIWGEPLIQEYPYH